MSYFERLRTTNKPKVETICLVDENAFQILAAWHMEDGGIILDSLEIVIGAKGIEIAHTLTDAQYDLVCEQINSRI